MYQHSLHVLNHVVPMWRAILFGTFIGAVFAALAGCDHQPETASGAIPVRVVVAQPGSMEVAGITFSGTLVPRVESQLAFRVPGRIVERRADVGATVARGDVLARLDDTPFKLAIKESQADLAQARATLARVQRDVGRNRALARSGAIAGADFDALQTQRIQARAQVRAAQSRLDRARNDLAYATLTAPAAGTIADVAAEAGQVVAVGTPVLRLAHTGEQEVQVDVSESRIGQLTQAQVAIVRLLSLPGVELTGIVREVASVADGATRTYRVRVALPELPEAARLGMTASVRFKGAAGTHVQLPISALFQQGEQPAVWVLPDDATQLELRPIMLAAMGTDTIAVARGVAPGERVVVAGVHRLDANVAVRVWDGRLP